MQVQCARCQNVFALEVPRTWIRCPQCGQGFGLPRDRWAEAAGAGPVEGARPIERWRVVSPAGRESAFDTFEELRESIATGKISDAPRSDRIEVLPSDFEVLSNRDPSNRDAPNREPSNRDVSVHEQPTLELPAITVHVRDDGTEEIEEATRVGPAPSSGSLKRPITLKRPFAPEMPPRRATASALAEPARSEREQRTNWPVSIAAIAFLGVVGVALVHGSRGAADASPTPPLASTARPDDATAEDDAGATAAPSPHAEIEPPGTIDPVAPTSGTSSAAPHARREGELAASDPASVQAKQERALAAFRAGDYEAARTIYDALLETNPQDESTLAALGDTLRAQGEKDASARFYKRAVAVNPRYAPARVGLADVTWDMGDRKGAQSMYADLVAHFPSDVVPDRARQRASSVDAP